MATYIQLRDLFNNGDLLNRTDIAVVISANNLIGGVTPTTAQQKWAAKVFDDPRAEGRKALMAVLATNRNATTAQITGADDATLQTAVDNVTDALVAAYAG